MDALSERLQGGVDSLMNFSSGLGPVSCTPLCDSFINTCLILAGAEVSWEKPAAGWVTEGSRLVVIIVIVVKI